jgi:hypothetical protein
MVVIARWIGFVISAVAVQLASGIGLLALVLCALLGWFRVSFFWILVPLIGGAVAAHFLFDDVSSGGKVVNAMSNLTFELIIYAIICLFGFAIGALARRFR